MDSLSNVVNDILIDEINQKDGVFRHENISRDGNIFVGEDFCCIFSNSAVILLSNVAALLRALVLF